MLKPEYIEQLPDRLAELYGQAEMDILADMARRISTYDYWIPAAQHQYTKLVQMGGLHEAIIKRLSAMTGKTAEELTRLMAEAGETAVGFDSRVYKSHGLSPPSLASSGELQGVLVAGFRQTKGTFFNLTATTAATASKQFENALDRVWMQISSGAFDHNAAVRTAVKDLSRQGIGAITYPSGHVDSMDVAVRRAVVTGVNQTALRVQDELADMMCSDLVEVTAHAGARPDHALWQGGIYSRSGKSRKYRGLKEATGYGTGAGLGGWNCRHNFNPWFEGDQRAFGKETLQAFEARNITYNGEKLTEFEAVSKQRYIERQIRRWQREAQAMKAAGQTTDEAAGKVAQWQGTQRDFIRQTGLKRQYDREQIT